MIRFGSVYVELRGDRGSSGCWPSILHVKAAALGWGADGCCRSVLPEHTARCHADLSVVNLREELPPFYRHLGYSDCGTEPFPDHWPSDTAVSFRPHDEAAGSASI